ncbi:MAG TPA: hypothetical protein VLN25_11695 [Burkholderiaceae bacterium]|nr:hypothetical protein [Burkholderiaceae bacterium]
MSLTPRRGCRAMRLTGLALLAAFMPLSSAMAQSEGGLYIAGDAGFKFRQAAERGLAQNPGGRRFFVLAVPPQTSALKKSATGPLAQLRDRVIAGNGVLFVCQRDIDKGRIDPAELVPGVVAVRGFPPPGSNAIPAGERYFPDEDRSRLPASNEALRRLRATCSS